MSDFGEVSPEGVVVFKGNPGEACEDLIRSIRSKAFSEGKQRDNEWICDFASTCFSGRALRWYETLDEDVQESWTLLRRALLAEYPPQDEVQTPLSPTVRSDPTIPVPAAAAAPPGAFNLRQNSFFTPPSTPATGGLIRAFFTSTKTSGDFYISKNVYDSGGVNPTFEGCAILKSSKDDALRVQYTPSPSGQPHVLTMTNSSSGKTFLSAMWHANKPKVGPGSSSYALLTTSMGVAENSVTSLSHSSWKGPVIAAIWTVAADGTVNAVWRDTSGVLHTLDIVVLPPGKFGLPIELVADAASFTTKYPGWCKARLVFMPSL